MLEQCLPFTVCAEGCETAEEQSDDEVRTSQVPEQSEGKTKVMKQQYLPFTVLKRVALWRYIQRVFCCNSTYRLRYAPKDARPQRSSATMRSAHLKYLNEEKVKQRWWGNSTYRLRYAPKGARQQRSKATMRSVHLLPERRDGKTKVVKS